MRRLVRPLLALLVVLLVWPASPASAHAAFEASEPVDGSVLVSAPGSVVLTFSEAVLLDASRVTLTRLGPGTTETLTIAAAQGGTAVRATLPPLGDGAYLIRFQVVDPADLHRTVGSLAFGVGVPAPGSQRGEELDSAWWVSVTRAGADALLLLAVGAVALIWLAVRRAVGVPDSLVRVAVGASVGTAAAWVVLFVADVGSVGFAHARWGSLLVGSDPGRKALIGVELALGVWWAARLLRTTAPAGRPLIATILAILAGGLLVVGALGGHAGVGGSTLVGLALRVVHLGSLSVWLGSVAALWWIGRSRPGLRVLWPDVSRAAAVGLALTGATGALMTARVASTVTAVLGTSYGRMILLKVVLVLVLAVLGWRASERVRHGGVPTVVVAELALGSVALLLAALLVGGAPAVGERFEPAAARPPQVSTGDVADLTVSMRLEPALPGANLMRVSVLDTRRPSPGDVTSVTVALRRADGRIVAQRQAVPSGGVVEWADVQIDAPGTYRVDVTVDRPDAPVPVFSPTAQVEPQPVPRATTVVSDAPLAPYAAGAAVAWLLLVGSVAAARQRAPRLRDRTGIRSPAR